MMTESLPPQIDSDARVPRKHATWKMMVLTLLSILALLGAGYLPIHIRHQQQMEAITVVERLGGSVSTTCDAPEWLQRLQPDSVLWRLDGLGPNSLREYLPAEAIVDHFLVAEAVYADEGPGMRVITNISGERRDVDRINVTDDDLVYIGRLVHLERLYLRHMPVTDAGLTHLRNLRQMKHLYLSYTQITDESAETLAGFENLEILRLVGTRFTDSGLAKLEKLRHLQELDVRGTQVTGNGLKPFRGRPGLRLLGDGPDDPQHGLLFTY